MHITLTLCICIIIYDHRFPEFFYIFKTLNTIVTVIEVRCLVASWRADQVKLRIHILVFVFAFFVFVFVFVFIFVFYSVFDSVIVLAS